jgi:hypothetical protein
MKTGPSVTVTLSRLEGTTHNMWVAIAVEDGPGALTSIQARSLIASRLKCASGKNGAELFNFRACAPHSGGVFIAAAQHVRN